MLLNGSALNDAALNAFSYAGESGEGALISFEQSVALVGVGALIEVEQLVALIGSGSLIGIEQEIELLLSGNGSLVNVEQEVLTTASGLFIGISQTLLSAREVAQYVSNSWNLRVSLGGFNIPQDTIQEVSVVHGIGDDSRATVNLNPGAAVYNLYSYQGKQLIISARTGSTYKRIFTGVVDIPRVQVVNEKIVLEGVSSRETLIRGALTPFVAGIGSYSETVFGPKNNVFQETNDRMSTIPSDLDFDPYGNWTVTSWTPKSVADSTLTNANLYREQQPEVRIESSREVVNRVGITLTYAYQRLHQVGLRYSWNSSLSACDFLTLGYTLPSREMIRTAAAGTGWKINDMDFTDLWPSGFYHCGGFPIGWVNTFRDVIIRETPATDPSGNNYTQSQQTGINRLSALRALGAIWTTKKRFTQNIQETYSMVVNSPQSQTLYGLREKNENMSLQAEFDPSQWEDEALYDKEFDGTRIAATGTTYYINRDVQNVELNQAITTALNKAKTDILRSHRDTEVSYTTFVNPDVQLKHTIYVNTTRINTKGKIRSITHTFKSSGEATTSVKLALYRAVGSQAETALTAPSRPPFATPTTMANAALGSRWGQDPSQPGAKNWNGYVGNKWTTVGGGYNSNTYKTNYQESFIVDSPAIPAAKRDQQNYSLSGSYNISIPTDTFTITFLDS